MIDYANDTLGLKRSDKQPISTFAELNRALKKLKKEGAYETVYDVKYTPFPAGWETENEPKIMKMIGYEYRPWTTSEPLRKGYVARINTAMLNNKRKYLSKDVKRRQAVAEKNISGKKIRKSKDIIIFDTSKHVCYKEKAVGKV